MGRPVWRDVLEATQLNDAERSSLRRDGAPDSTVTLRLWGLIAAKEAARRLWLANGGKARFPADLNVVENQDETGRVERLILSEEHEQTTIVIARAEGAVMAMAHSDVQQRIGIGLVRIESDDDEWEARRASAIKAATQSLGFESAKVVAADRATGEVFITCSNNPRETICAVTNRRGRYIWAWTPSPIGAQR